MTERLGIHCFVTGKVQGVWFRASTKEQAESLGLVGWVRNLPDGRVEVKAFGEKKFVQQLREWLKQGPPLAKVTDLACEEVLWEAYEKFEVR